MIVVMGTDGSIEEAVRSLGAEASDRHSELEAGRRVPDDLYEKTAEAGLFRQLVPSELGGLGRSPMEWFATGVELARSEASYAWVVTQGAAGLALIAAGGHPDLLEAVLADSTGAVTLSIAGAGSLTPSDGGFDVEGRWGFGSGCDGATWLGGLSVVKDQEPVNGMPELRYALVPSGRARIERSWDPIGMVGTGSDTIVIERQQIPDEWTLSTSKTSTWQRGPIAVAVGNGNWPIATSVAAVQLGTARLALDLATEMLPTKRPMPTFQPLSQNASVQRQLMRAEAMWNGCRAAVVEGLTELWSEAQQEGRLSTATRTKLLLANANANHTAVQIVDTCCELLGTAVVPAEATLGLCLRNAHTLLGHISTNSATFEFAGQVHFGHIEEHRLV